MGGEGDIVGLDVGVLCANHLDRSPGSATSSRPTKEPKGFLCLSLSVERDWRGAVDPPNLKHEYLTASLSQKAPTLSRQGMMALLSRKGT